MSSVGGNNSDKTLERLDNLLEIKNKPMPQDNTKVVKPVIFENKNIKDQTSLTKESTNSSFVITSLEMFDDIDKNKDGILSKSELVSKMKDSSIKGNKAATLGTMIQKYDKLKQISDDETLWESGITKKDLKNATESEYNSQVNYRINRINSAKNDKGDFKFPSSASEINYKDIQQGEVGDCYFLAALTSLAKTRPQEIINMVKDNKDGTFTVKFARGSVTVKAPTDTELSMYAKGKSWVPLIERAYAEYRNNVLGINVKENPYDSTSGSIFNGRGIYDLTGHSYDGDILAVTFESTTRTKLENAMKNNKMVTAGINKELIWENDLKLPSGHAYSVIGYDKKTDMVTIRNPWGYAEPTKNGVTLDGNNDGIFQMKLSDFHKYFSRISYEE